MISGNVITIHSNKFSYSKENQDILESVYDKKIFKLFFLNDFRSFVQKTEITSGEKWVMLKSNIYR